MEGTDGEDNHLIGVDLTAVDGLEREHNMGRHVDGVDIPVGRGAVPAPAVDGDGEHVAGAAGGAGGVVYRSEGRLNHMQGHGGVHVGVFQNSGVKDILRAVHGLLRRLKEQLYRAPQLSLVLPQQPGGAQQGGGVEIVPAGVHAPVFRGEGQSGLLLHGQGVHIPPQQKDRSAPADGTGDAGPPHVLGLIAHFTQFFKDKSPRHRQIKAQLRVAVKLPPPRNQLVPQRQSFLINLTFYADATPPAERPARRDKKTALHFVF